MIPVLSSILSPGETSNAWLHFAHRLIRLPNIQSENLFIVPPELLWEESATHRSFSITWALEFHGYSGILFALTVARCARHGNMSVSYRERRFLPTV
jgi:hypothetical protein